MINPTTLCSKSLMVKLYCFWLAYMPGNFILLISFPTFFLQFTQWPCKICGGFFPSRENQSYVFLIRIYFWNHLYGPADFFTLWPCITMWRCMIIQSHVTRLFHFNDTLWKLWAIDYLFTTRSDSQIIHLRDCIKSIETSGVNTTFGFTKTIVF